MRAAVRWLVLGVEEKEGEREFRSEEKKEEAEGRDPFFFYFFLFPFFLLSAPFFTSQGLPRRARGLVQENSGADRGREGVEVRAGSLQGRDGRGRGRREGRRIR